MTDIDTYQDTTEDEALESARADAREWRDVAEEQASEIASLRAQVAESQAGRPAEAPAVTVDPLEARFGPDSEWARDLELARARGDRASEVTLLEQRNMAVMVAGEGAKQEAFRAEQDARVNALPEVVELDARVASLRAAGDDVEAGRLASTRREVVRQALARDLNERTFDQYAEHTAQEWAQQALGQLAGGFDAKWGDGTPVDDAGLSALLEEKQSVSRSDGAHPDFDAAARLADVEQRIGVRVHELAVEAVRAAGLPPAAQATGQGADPQTARARYADAEAKGDVEAMIAAQSEISADWRREQALKAAGLAPQAAS